MKKLFAALIVLTLVGFGLPASAAEPSLHAVYQTANAGRLDEARAMMRDVLAAHPNSGKAPYVEAELLARQGQLKQAASELATAEKLAPGLPFASTDSVSKLKSAVHRSASPAGAQSAFPVASAATAAPAASFPWGMLAAGLAGIAFIAWAARLMRRRESSAPARPGASAYGATGTSGTSVAAPPAYGPQSPAYGAAGTAPANAPGFGTQMLGGLATGVAVGAGVAAGQALMHRFMDGSKTSPGLGDTSGHSGFSDLGPSTNARDTAYADNSFADAGDEDFGISDTASWDDGGSSSDSDWN